MVGDRALRSDTVKHLCRFGVPDRWVLSVQEKKGSKQVSVSGRDDCVTIDLGLGKRTGVRLEEFFIQVSKHLLCARSLKPQDEIILVRRRFLWQSHKCQPDLSNLIQIESIFLGIFWINRLAGKLVCVACPIEFCDSYVGSFAGVVFRIIGADDVVRFDLIFLWQCMLGEHASGA